MIVKVVLHSLLIDNWSLQGWPVVQPDVLISTPGTLLNWLFAFDPRRWRRTAFVRDVKYVVCLSNVFFHAV
jgi:hypothetical protein